MDNVKNIDITAIIEPPVTMRIDPDDDTIRELADSIREYGLINPITVRPAGDKYEVIAGHRRLLACRRVGCSPVPCVIRDCDEKTKFSVMAQENLNRKDTDPVEEAIFFQRLINECGMSISEIAARQKHSEQWVQDRLAIIDFPDNIINFLREKKINLGVAKNLAAIKDAVYRDMYVDSAVRSGMSVRQAEYLLAQYEMGCMPDSATIMPVDDIVDTGERYRARAVCARCGTLAIEPNLRNVFIHMDCPSEKNE